MSQEVRSPHEVIKEALLEDENKLKQKEFKANNAGNGLGLFSFDSKLALDSIGLNSSFDKGIGFVIGLLIVKTQAQIRAAY